MKKPLGVLVIALVASMSVAGVALADDSDDSPEAAIITPQIFVDTENGTIVIALPVDGELPECAPDDGGDGGETGPVDDAVAGDEATSYGPGDCVELVIDHPSGKTHHGVIVSTVAKNLHPSMLEGIKKGEIMRYVAKTGKVGEGDSDGGGDGELKVKKDKPKKDKPEKAAKKARIKKGPGDKAAKKDKPGNGRGKR